MYVSIRSGLEHHLDVNANIKSKLFKTNVNVSGVRRITEERAKAAKGGTKLLSGRPTGFFAYFSYEFREILHLREAMVL